MAVLVPRGIDQDALRILARGLHRLEKEGLEVPGVGKWHLREVPPDDSPLATLDMNTWTNPSRTWTTATPMVFGHFPKASKGGEAKVVLDSLSLVGIDPSIVVELAVGRHSPLHGVPPSWSFAAERNPREFKGPKRIVAHVTIRFHRPVRGPIVIGALRYFGLGLMRPLEV
jgi:CRISPR-associated protein Csb2